MEVLHGIWHPTKNQIGLWIETKDKIYAPNKQLASGIVGKVNILLPTHNTAAVASPLIAREYNLDTPDKLDWQYHQVGCLYVNPSIIKNIFSAESLRFAPDFVYWQQIIDVVSEILEHELYIPSINQNNEPVWTTYHPDVELLAKQMPEICRYIDNNCYSNIGLLRHFFDHTVTNLVKTTYLSNDQSRIISGTFLESFFNSKTKKFSDLDKEHWLTWKSALDHNKHNICIKLEAPENRDSQWSLAVLKKSDNDQSKYEIINNRWHDCLSDLGLAMRIYPDLERAFNEDRVIPFKLTQEDARFFLKETAWTLQQSGFTVIIPSWYTPKGYNTAKLKLKHKKTRISSQNENSYFTLEGILSFEYSLSLNGQDITVEEWKQLIANKEELVQFRGEWVQLDLTHMDRILDFWKNNQVEDLNIFQLLNKASHPDIEFDHNTDQFLTSLYSKQNFTILDTPGTFQGTLRPYQQQGFSWIRYMEQIGLNPCLADDMGLGKTVQIIAHIAATQNAGNNLLVVPTSVIGNWEREFARFAPHISICTYHSRSKGQNFNEYDVVLTTFTMLRKNYKLFTDIKWHRIILDEAQNIKNPKAQQSKSLFDLKAKHYVALTGTPIENSVVDLWSIFNFLNRDYLGDLKIFKRQFHGEPENRPRLKRLIEPFILRRLKTDKSIISELPDKIEQKVYCQLTKEQASLYQAVVNQISDKIKNGEFASADMLSSLTRLKQICNHPMQYLQDNSEFAAKRSLKLQRLDSIIDEAIENKESILVFSQYKEICEAINKFFALKYNTYLLHGSISRTARDAMIEEFQDETTPPSIFILSLKAGGVGITLTKASQVIHFDRWWNPAVENQATDRAFRIGQQKKVLVHKFITQGTLEETIDQIIADKITLSESILSDDSSWLKDLNTQTFMDLIKLRQEALSGE
jgi:hypothetical protein